MTKPIVSKWTTSADLHARVRRLWDRGDLLSAAIRGESLFPLEISLKRPAAREIAERFGAVMDWAEALRADSRAVRGTGYDLRWQPVANRVQGTNELPVAAVFPTEGDALRFIRRATEAR